MIKPRERKQSGASYLYTALDIETDRNGSVLAIGLAYYEAGQRCYQQFATWRELLDFLLPNATRLKQLRTIYAHNGASFDWLSFMQFVQQHPDRYAVDHFQMILSNAKAVGASIRLNGKKGTIQLRDSWQLFPQALSTLATTAQTEYRKLGRETHPEDLYRDDRQMFDDYLMHDCYALQEVLAAFHRLINDRIGYLDSLPMTLSSLSLNLWKDYYLDAPIYTTWNKHTKDLEKAAYTGSRVQVFQHGEHEQVNEYDFNGHYQAVMRDNQFPIAYDGYWTEDFDPGMLGIYQVTFNQTNTEKAAVLMVAGEPCYQGSGTYCSPELLKLLEIGGSFTVERGYVYLETGNPFRGYIETLIEMREEAQAIDDQALSYLCKILGNSLYGKFGQRSEKETIEYLTNEQIESYIDQGVGVVEYGEYCVVRTESWVEHQFFAVAAFVTCYARLKLYEFIVSTRNVLYCDTDSIHTTSDDLDCHVGPHIGQMKKKTFVRESIAGKKLRATIDEHGEMHVTAKSVVIGGESGDQTINYHTIAMIAGDPNAEYISRFKAPPTVRAVLLRRQQACRWEPRRKTLRRTGVKLWQP